MCKPLLPATVARHPLRCTQEEASAGAGSGDVEEPKQTAYSRFRPSPKSSPASYAMQTQIPVPQPSTPVPQTPTQPTDVPKAVAEWFPASDGPAVPLVLGMRGDQGNFAAFDPITAALLDGCISQIWHPVCINGTIIESYDEPIYRAVNGFTYAKLADGWYLSAEPFTCVKTASTQD